MAEKFKRTYSINIIFPVIPSHLQQSVLARHRLKGSTISPFVLCLVLELLLKILDGSIWGAEWTFQCILSWLSL